MRDLLDELQLDQPDVRITNINSNNNNRNILNNSGNSLGSSSDYDEKEGWILCPMIPSDPNATSLGQILTDILVRTRQQISDRKQRQQKGNVVFLGMDCPELPLEEIVASLVAGNVAFNRCKKENDSNVESATQPELASRNSRMKEKNVKAPLATPISSSSTAAAAAATLSSAVICPANDGGYGMLCVPPQAPADTVFKGIRWSNRLTALGQIKALTDCSIPVRLGRMMNDIDEPDDVHGLCQRLSKKLMEESSRNCEVTKNGALVTNKTERKYDGDILSRSSKFSGAAQTGDCHYTAIALKELNLL